MLAVLSPSKTLAECEAVAKLPTGVKAAQPAFLKRSVELVDVLRGYSPADLKSLMGISDKLALLNCQRYQDFSTPFTPKNATPALLTFKGDVYEPMGADRYTPKQWQFAQAHLRILSGLYGLLGPCDFIQPYRLEMGIGLNNAKGKNLYEFWGKDITKELNKALAASGDETLINLASEEYFKAVSPKALKGQLVNIIFKDMHKGALKIIGLHAKKARGTMADWMITKGVAKPEGLKKFTGLGYAYAPKLSDAQNWVFTR